MVFIQNTPPPEKRTESVFVYGTLLNPYIRSVACMCRTPLTPAALPQYKKVGRNIIPNEDSVVTGAIIHVTTQELWRLDRYEKVPQKYRRESIEINDQLHWVYLLNERKVEQPSNI